MGARITVVGSLNMDLIIRTPRIPKPGETILGSGFHQAPGGKGANQAVAAALLGAEVALVGRVGEDNFAQTLIAKIDQAGVNHNYVTRDPDRATGVAFISVDDEGENSIVVASGANMHFPSEEIDAASELIASSDVLLLQLEIPMDIVAQAVQMAKENQVKVVLNPAPAQQLPHDLLESIDVLIPNEGECATLSGMPAGDLSEIKEAARALLDTGVSAVVVTLGGRGAFLLNRSSSDLVPAYEVDVVDTTAAGDAFVGGFAVALGEVKPLNVAVRWGNAAGALAATKLGAQTSLPSREDVERLLADGEQKSG